MSQMAYLFDASESVEKIASRVAVHILAETFDVTPTTVDKAQHCAFRHGLETLDMTSQTVQAFVVPRTRDLELVDCRRVLARLHGVRIGRHSAAPVQHFGNVGAVGELPRLAHFRPSWAKLSLTTSGCDSPRGLVISFEASTGLEQYQRNEYSLAV